MKCHSILWGVTFTLSLSHANEVLRNLPADSWYHPTGTKMRAVCASAEAFPSAQGVGGCAMVQGAWSGGAYEQAEKRLWIWGGGHNDYYGNELYVFDVEHLKWIRYTDPTPVTALSVDPMPEGLPASRHSYDGLMFIDHAQQFFGFGGSQGGNGYGTRVTWIFDPAEKSWANMEPAGKDNAPGTNCCNFTGEYDPHSKRIFMRDPNWLCAYDFEKNSWSHVLEWTHVWEPQKTVVDNKRHLLFTAGSTEFLVYDIMANKDVSAQWETTGDTAILNGRGIGMAYDSKADVLVAWMGGSVHVLDLETKVWTRKSSIGAPTKPVETGTYGRFRYIPDDNVFVLVNGVDEDVYFYKLTAGAGDASAAIPTGKVGRTGKPTVTEVRDVSGRRLYAPRPTGRRISFSRVMP